MKRYSIMLLIIALVLTAFPLNVGATTPIAVNLVQKPNADITLTLGDTSVDTANFQTDLTNLLKQKGIDPARVNINALQANTVSASAPVGTQWENYSHTVDQGERATTAQVNSGVPSIWAGSHNGTDHIYINGTTMMFLGYGSSGYTDFKYMANSDKTKKTFTFDINESGINYHSMLGGGFLFNITTSGAGTSRTMSGYMILFEQSGIKLYKLTNVNMTNFSNGTRTGMTQVGSTVAKASGTTHAIKIEVTPTKLNMWDNSIQKFTNQALDVFANPTYGFGPIAAYSGHGCSALSYFTFSNLGMETTSAQSFNDVVKKTTWRDGTKRFVVNLQDTAVADFSSATTTAEILGRFASDDVHYVGWGTTANSVEATTFIGKNGGRGTFENNSNYSTSLNNIAEYIKTVLNAADVSGSTTYLLGESMTFSPPTGSEGTGNTWSVVHDKTYYENNEGDSVYNGISRSDLKIVFDKPGKYTISYSDGTANAFAVTPDVYYAHRRPIAQFIPTVSGGILSATSTSYDLDSQSTTDSGIAAWEWTYKETTATTATTVTASSLSGITLNAETRYLVQLRVQDTQGAWSEPLAQVVSTVNGETMKPIASFQMSPMLMNLSSTTNTSINDTSYSPSGHAISSRLWTVTKDGTSIYSSTTGPKLDFSGNTAGQYIVSLKVTANSVDSDVFSRTLYLFNDPTLVTTTASSITKTTATLSGDVTNDGGLNILTKGFVYSKNSATPTLSNGTSVEVGRNTGAYTSNISGLTAGSTYYFRTYVTRSSGVSYGPILNFDTSADPITGIQINPNTGGSTTSASIDENLPVGTVVGVFKTNVANAVYTYAFNDTANFPDNNKFSISGGQLIATESFDYETTTSYTIQIKPTNANPTNYVQTIRVLINDVNEAPTISSTTPSTVLNFSDVTSATSSSAILSKDFYITDPDSIITTTAISITSSNTTMAPVSGFSVVQDPNDLSKFTVTGSTVQGVFGSSLITVTVADGGFTKQFSFYWNVHPYNQTPTITANDITIAEDAVTTASIVVLDGVNETPLAGITPATVTIISDPNGLFSGGGSLTTSRGANGEVYLNVQPSANLSGQATVMLSVTDDGSYAYTDTSGAAISVTPGTVSPAYPLTPFSAQKTIKINITPANDAPTIGALSNIATLESTTTASIAITIGDIDNDASSLNVLASSDNDLLVPDTGYTFGGSGSNRTLLIRPKTGENGIANVTVTVRDGLNTSSETFRLTVSQIVQPPAIASIPNTTVNEDFLTNINLVITDPDTAGSDLVTTVSSTNLTLVPLNNIVISGDLPNQTITITPAANQYGSSTITISVTDGTFTTTRSFVYAVNSSNDAPNFSKGADITLEGVNWSKEIANWATNMTVGPADESAQTYEFILTADRPELFRTQPTLSVDGKLGFNTSGRSGSAIVQVKMVDSGGTANGGLEWCIKYFVININSERPLSSSGSNGGIVTENGDSKNSKKSKTKVIVNKKVQEAGDETKTVINNKTMVTVVVEKAAVDAKIDEVLALPAAELPKQNTVSIPVESTNNDKLSVALEGDILKKMETKAFDLEVKSDNVAYTIPVSEIKLDAVAQTLNVGSDLSKLVVDIQIDKAEDNIVTEIKKNADNKSYTLVVEPVSFEVKVSTADSQVNVSVNKFSQYVERTIAIPEGIDPNKITTGIVYNADGTFSHVPTTIIVVDGKYYAQINSLTNSIYSVIYNPIAFADMTNHWAKSAVNDMGSRLVVSGRGNNVFDPEKDVTRGEFAIMVTKALGIYRTNVGTDKYSDIKKASIYYDAISIAAEYNLITGYTDGTFKADGNITREEAMAILSRAVKWTKLQATQSADLGQFKDADQIAEWAKAYATESVSKAIIQGNNGLIRPKDNISRAEAATTLQRVLQQSELINK